MLATHSGFQSRLACIQHHVVVEVVFIVSNKTHAGVPLFPSPTNLSRRRLLLPSLRAPAKASLAVQGSDAASQERRALIVEL